MKRSSPVMKGKLPSIAQISGLEKIRYNLNQELSGTSNFCPINKFTMERGNQFHHALKKDSMEFVYFSVLQAETIRCCFF